MQRLSVALSLVWPWLCLSLWLRLERLLRAVSAGELRCLCAH